MRFRLLVAFALPLAGAACANSGVMVGGPGVQVGIPIRREPPMGDTVADRLYFGRDIPGGGTVTDSAWSAFLREVVTPRFPAGLTIFRAEGQWRMDDGTVVGEQSFVVEVIHPASPAVDTSLLEIAEEYKRRFNQEAVMRVTLPARQRFHE